VNLKAGTVTFKSSPEWYAAEVQGIKPCTVRLMSEDEFCELADYDPEHICIVSAVDEGECFTRLVLSIHRVGSLLGNVLALVCWEEP